MTCGPTALANPRTLAGLGALLVLASCVAPPPTPQQSQQLLATAEAQITAGSFDDAIAALDSIDELRCPKRLRDRRDIARAEAELGRGKPWRAYLALDEFNDLYPYSERRGRVVEILWQASKAMFERDSNVLFFWSDRNGGRTVLEHLITRNPDTQRLADALRILGDIEFENGNYEMAQERYRDIILNRPESDWRFYAQFRFAMSIVAGLRGPDYDLDRMQHAVTELRGFLDNAPENPEMRGEAERALQQVLGWQMQRHLLVADYYRTLKNIAGQRLHLQQATGEEYALADGYDQAVARLASFEEETAANAAAAQRKAAEEAAAKAAEQAAAKQAAPAATEVGPEGSTGGRP
ncbi:MAG: tol-pal system YbgF family protein [Planctomycetota bacterium]